MEGNKEARQAGQGQREVGCEGAVLAAGLLGKKAERRGLQEQGKQVIKMTSRKVDKEQDSKKAR